MISSLCLRVETQIAVQRHRLGSVVPVQLFCRKTSQNVPLTLYYHCAEYNDTLFFDISSNLIFYTIEDANMTHDSLRYSLQILFISPHRFAESIGNLEDPF